MSTYKVIEVNRDQLQLTNADLHRECMERTTKRLALY